MKTISTNTAVFLVKFRNSSECHIFGQTPETLGELIKSNGNNGIEYIKQYDPVKMAFKAMSKKTLFPCLIGIRLAWNS